MVNDRLNRKEKANRLSSELLKGTFSISKEASSVIAIDGSWGTGKSVFLDYLCESLIEESKIYNSDPNRKNDKSIKTKSKIIRFNAWINDSYNNPLPALVYEIFSTLKKDTSQFNLLIKSLDNILNTKDELLKNAITHLIRKKGNLLKDIIHMTDDLDLISAYNALTDEKNLSQEISQYNDHIETKQILDKLFLSQDNIEDVIVIVDELDRCRPEYAIRLLEVVKHYFCYDNFIFIFGVDFNQLCKSAKKIYGNEMDVNGYMSRFFDYVLKLSNPDDNGRALIKSYVIDIFGNQGNDIDISFLIDLSSDFKLSYRELQQVLISFSVIKKIEGTTWDQVSKLIIFLIAFKFKLPESYSAFLWRNVKEFDNGNLISSLPLTKETTIINEFLNCTLSHKTVKAVKDNFKASNLCWVQKYGDAFFKTDMDISYGEYFDNLITLNSII